jgi:hypothetical protein
MSGTGQQDITDGNGAFNATSFLVRQMLAETNTADLVKVVSVTSAGALAKAGVVAVQPLVNQIDGQGNATPHGTIYNLIYFRMQGGANAVILDPAVGDIGMAAYCSRDISARSGGTTERTASISAACLTPFLRNMCSSHPAESTSSLPARSDCKRRRWR